MERLTIIGNLGGDPEMKYTPSGTAVTNFSVAVNQNYVNRDGEKVDRPPKWFRVACWNKLAETTNEHLSKGRQVMVEGVVDASHYESQGETRVSLEVRAFTVKFLSGGQGNGNGAPAGTGGVPDDEDDDLPW